MKRYNILKKILIQLNVWRTQLVIEENIDHKIDSKIKLEYFVQCSKFIKIVHKRNSALAASNLMRRKFIGNATNVVAGAKSANKVECHSFSVDTRGFSPSNAGRRRERPCPSVLGLPPSGCATAAGWRRSPRRSSALESLVLQKVPARVCANNTQPRRREVSKSFPG